MIAVVDIRTPQKVRERLAALHCRTLPLPPFSRLAAPVASHPDMLMLPFAGRLFVHRTYFEEYPSAVRAVTDASQLPLSLVDSDVSPVYPADIALNAFVLGKHLVGRIDRIPALVRETAEQNGYRLLNTRQGYAKCSTVVLGEDAVITADPSIAATCRAIGADVLTVSPHGVSLPAYDHGFLGGATGVYGNTVYICGDLGTHPDADAIAAFCRAHGFETVSLSGDPLLDIGSIYFL